MNITIYQINSKRDSERVKFEGLRYVSSVDPSIYDEVFTGNVSCTTLDEVFEMFNINHPEGFKGHSLSVSDVVKTSKGYFYCDSYGWEPIKFI